jgi:hypothetical protein
MKLTELIDELGLHPRSALDNLDAEVTGGYASDLLSDVLAHGEEGNLWITLQAHANIVAVASMKGFAGILLVGAREPQEGTLERAESERIPILVSELPAFELVGRLYGLGIRGNAPEGSRAG